MKRSFFSALLALSLILLCLGGHKAWAETRFGAPQDVIKTGVLQSLFSEYKRQTGKTVTIVPYEGRELVFEKVSGIDLVLTDSPPKFARAGQAGNRTQLLRSELVLAGPAEDRARVRGLHSVLEALRRIASSGSQFISRADGSGTSIRESDLWKEAGVNTQGRAWYLKSGRNMIDTLEIASLKRAYTLTDRASYLTWKNRFSLELLVHGDPRLHFIYDVIEIAQEKGTGDTGKLLEFLRSKRAREIISKFGSEKYGAPLYSAP